ncbi:MAG: cation diffusion facilitator family transporter [Nitrospina sp.]|nr:cation diffusion facilitator family transporter [Nitrospina sp.]MBT6716225.1 cation diffusion facilitator family transporter [Nitrospina sp.]
MSSFLEAVSTQPFMQNAIVGGILASVACGAVGSYVVVKRIGYLAGGIAHAVLGGMGIAYYLGRSPIEGALVSALVFAFILGWVSLRMKQQEDTIIGALWAGGMAVGILFISQTPGYNVDLMSFLFGNILMIASEDLYWIAGLDIFILLIVFLFYKQFISVSFDEEFARLRGIPVERFYLLFLSLVALTVVILIQIVGLILVIALLTLPAAIAGLYVRSLSLMMLLATLFGMVFTTGGLALSYQPDLPPGPTIILLAGAFYLLSLVLNLVKKKNITVTDCCSGLEKELHKVQDDKRNILVWVLIINGSMFFIEGIYGWLAQSSALMADALDMLGDAAIFGFSLYVIRLGALWQSRAGYIKGVIMALFSISVLAGAVYRSFNPVVPEATTMGIIGFMALAANLICAIMLLGFRDSDINMRSAWLCSRNDVLANVGVLLAAAGVAWTQSPWPDLVVGVSISALILKSAIEVLKDAKLEMVKHRT